MASLIPIPFIPSAVRQAVGLFLYSGAVNILVFGIVCSAGYRHLRKADAPRRVKYMIAAMLIMNAVHVAIDVVAIDHYIRQSFGNILAFLTTDWALSTVSILTVLCNILVRLFLTGVVSRMCGHRWILKVSCLVLTLMSFGFGIAVSVKSFQNNNATALHDVAWLVYTVFSVSIVADVCIAGSLAFLLMESRTGIPRTDSILKVLTLYFINTGAIIVCCDLACIICFAAMPGNYIFLGIFIVSPKLYFWSLLAALDNQDSFRSRKPTPAFNYPLSDLERRPNPSASDMFPDKQRSFPVTISVETHTVGRHDHSLTHDQKTLAVAY